MGGRAFQDDRDRELLFSTSPGEVWGGRRPELGDEIGLASEWSVPWSDLMMVMFVLFVVLFTYHSAERDVATAFDPAAPIEATAPAAPPLLLPTAPEAVWAQSLAAMRESGRGQVEVVLQGDHSVRLSVPGPMLFELGKAELGPEARAFLDRLAGTLRGVEGRVRVVGHTDNFPVHSERFPTNWELSAARAAAVARHLIQAGGIDPARFTVVGRSMYQPAVPNTSLVNKARNRRVEILIERAQS